jgi:hypothetical protein
VLLFLAYFVLALVALSALAVVFQEHVLLGPQPVSEVTAPSSNTLRMLACIGAMARGALLTVVERGRCNPTVSSAALPILRAWRRLERWTSTANFARYPGGLARRTCRTCRGGSRRRLPIFVSVGRSQLDQSLAPPTRYRRAADDRPRCRGCVTRDSLLVGTSLIEATLKAWPSFRRTTP